MGTTKKWVVQMSDEMYCSMTPDARASLISAKVVYDDYELYKDDPKFKALYRDKKQATKKLDDYKYDKRHKL